MSFGNVNYVNAVNNSQLTSPKLRLNCLPEPYCGDPDANVYCLNMNPGEPDSLFDNTLVNNLYFQRAKDNLQHKVSSAFWTEGLVMSKSIIYSAPILFEYLLDKKTRPVYSIHEGAKWQREKTKELRVWLNGRNPNIFFLEYFPYHSKFGFDFPDFLPSYEYRNALLEFAMNEEKIIIIMRKEKKWYDIQDRTFGDIGNRLKDYKKKIILKYGQGGWLTRNNMTLPIPNSRCDCLTWNDIIRVI